MDLQVAGGGGGGRRPRRGFFVPDVRELMGIRKNKVLSRTTHRGSGNLNAIENQVPTPEELLSLFFDYLRKYGVSKEEFDTVFEAPKGRDDQGEVVNDLNEQAGGIYYEWAGLRREYYYLMLISGNTDCKQTKRQIKGNMDAIMDAIEDLKDELRPIFNDIKSRHRLPYEIPEVFLTDMVIRKEEVPKKRKK